MIQSDLFAYPNAPGFKARETSRAAAQAAVPMAMGLRARVYEAIKARPDTPEGIAKRLREPVYNVRPRCSELATKHKIIDIGLRGEAMGGGEAIVWKVAPPRVAA
jgi:hypothetical protein